MVLTSESYYAYGLETDASDNDATDDIAHDIDDFFADDIDLDDTEDNDVDDEDGDDNDNDDIDFDFESTQDSIEATDSNDSFDNTDSDSDSMEGTDDDNVDGNSEDQSDDEDINSDFNDDDDRLSDRSGAVLGGDSTNGNRAEYDSTASESMDYYVKITLINMWMILGLIVIINIFYWCYCRKQQRLNKKRYPSEVFEEGPHEQVQVFDYLVIFSCHYLCYFVF